MLTALLSLFLAGPAPVTIYVGPVVRDGFVDTDRGVQDSTKDIQTELRRVKGVSVVDAEPGADIRLYVVRRQKGAGPSGGVGMLSQGTGVGVSAPSGTYVLEATLAAGSYQRAFRVEQNNHTEWRVTWKKMARLLTKDVRVWLDANRDRVATK